MNLTQVKCLSVFSLFALIGFGPISPGCLIGMYIVSRRPPWFLQLTQQLYAGSAVLSSVRPTPAGHIRIRCFCSLVLLFIIDIAPVPVTPVLAFGIILARPAWFYPLVQAVYHSA